MIIICRTLKNEYTIRKETKNMDKLFTVNLFTKL